MFIWGMKEDIPGVLDVVGDSKSRPEGSPGAPVPV